MPAINLGMPAAPAPVLAPRKPTRRINVGKVAVGGGAPVSVQSMTTTKTTDINGTLQQIAQLTAHEHALAAKITTYQDQLATLETPQEDSDHA